MYLCGWWQGLGNCPALQTANKLWRLWARVLSKFIDEGLRRDSMVVFSLDSYQYTVGPGRGTHSWGVLAPFLQQTAFDLSELWSLQAGFSVKNGLQSESMEPSGVEVGMKASSPMCAHCREPTCCHTPGGDVSGVTGSLLILPDGERTQTASLSSARHFHFGEETRMS